MHSQTAAAALDLWMEEVISSSKCRRQQKQTSVTSVREQRDAYYSRLVCVNKLQNMRETRCPCCACILQQQKQQQREDCSATYMQMHGMHAYAEKSCRRNENPESLVLT